MPRPIRVLFSIAVSLSLVLSLSATSLAVDPAEFTVTPVTPDEVISTAKSKSGQLAQTDPDLLGRTGSERISVFVKLDYDPVASYAGEIAGLAATSPQATGKSLRANQRAVDAYLGHVARFEAKVTSAIQAQVPSAAIGDSFRIAYGGIAMTIPENQVANLLAVDGVAAVQQDVLREPLTDTTPEFLGATDVWPGLGGSVKAGEGVVVGILDTGIWPEHPSFIDHGLNPPPGTYGCEFGDGTDPLLGDPFSCNNKLVGAYAFVDTYMAVIGAEPGEFCNNDTGECSARDSDGHGTHTSSTAAGAPVASAELFGVDRGSISGMAPGAHVIMYRVCLDLGCFQSDSVAAVEQAIVDGVDVLNFSISGGSSAFTDPVELAFLDAYAAGILVNASAGNSGPGAGTANHAGPWTTTVGASTSDRHFVGTLTLTADNDDTFVMEGATITDGISTPTPVVIAADVAGQPDGFCRPAEEPPGVTFAPETFDGEIVVCARQVGARVLKSWNVLQGGASGMILYNALPNLGVNTDNHWVPSIHVEKTAEGTHPLIDFITSHTGVMATFTTGAPTPVTGDVMTSFSSRGPVGDFLKPDVTAPGIQILAGHTPDPWDENFVVGPPGEFFQAIAGTSMSSPHSAGVAALVKAAHPSWTPGQIKSALMTSSLQDVLKEDGVTAATPFDRGAGAIRANRAVNPTVAFDVDPADYFASALDPLGRAHLNLPSIYVNPMPGAISTTRTVSNVSGKLQTINVSTSAPAGSTITVFPSSFKLGPGASRMLQITIDGTGLADSSTSPYFGQITLDVQSGAFNDAVLPVAFFKQQGGVTLDHECDPTEFSRGETTDCSVTVTNLLPVESNASLTVKTNTNASRLRIQNVGAPGEGDGNGFAWSGTLTPALAPTVDAINPGGSPFGYVPLSLFPSITPVGGMGDESIVNFNLPLPYLYGSESYLRIGATSNGYAVVGGGTGLDVDFVPQDIPDPARPNNVLAPFWTDLNFTTGGALRAGILGSGGHLWLILDWENVPTFESAGAVTNSFQIWIGLGGDASPDVEDITFTFGPIGGPDGIGLTVGAENRDGSSAARLPAETVPANGDDFTIVTSPPTPGGSVMIPYEALGRRAGSYQITAMLTADTMVGTAKRTVGLQVNP